MMQEERSNIAGATGGRVGKSPISKCAESGPDDTWSSLTPLGEITTRAYCFSRLHELKTRKFVMEKALVDQHKVMTDILQKEVDDFQMIVRNETRLGDSRQYFLEECAQFERDLLEPWFTSLTIPSQDTSEAIKPKVSDRHETNSVNNRDQHVYTRAGQPSGRVPVKSVEVHEQVQTLQESQRESSTAQKSVPMANRQDTIRPQAHIYSQTEVSNPRDDTIAYSQQDISMPHDDTIAYSQQRTRSALDVSFSSRHEPAIERADASTGRSANTPGAGAIDVDDGCFQRHVTRKDLPSRADRTSIDLLLFGNCGHGKRSTGNTILGRPAFRRNAFSGVASASSASSIKMESTEFAGHVVNVIDGPSISVSGNTSMSAIELGSIIENIHQSVKLYECSFTALLIILKYGIRFPKHEIQALQVIKTVLGKDVIRDYGVCVITCGDIFDIFAKEARQAGDEITFHSWLESQTGEVRTLFEECRFRCVLFDNWTKDDHKRQAQLDTLMGILPKGKRYKKDAFLPARHGSQRLEMEGRLASLWNQAQVEAEKIHELIDQYEEDKTDDPDAGNIKLKLRVLKEQVKNFRTSSSELATLKMFLQQLERRLNINLNHPRTERDIEMDVGAQGTTPARSQTPLMAYQTTMAIHKTPYDSPGTEFSRDVSVPSDFNRVVAAPLGFATRKNKTSNSVDNCNHTFSNTGPMQGLTFNDNPAIATGHLEETGISDRHPDPPVNIKSFVAVGKEMASNKSFTPFLGNVRVRLNKLFD